MACVAAACRLTGLAALAALASASCSVLLAPDVRAAFDLAAAFFMAFPDVQVVCFSGFEKYVQPNLCLRITPVGGKNSPSFAGLLRGVGALQSGKGQHSLTKTAC